ncbi:MAG: NAD-dependent epimerase/dehydratase family protein [Chloroflexi bacterium]|nr:NAD-dependent epimerase/dehydratase family protein [Chloroflexota bacterium]
MKALVTGATGFIGANLVRELLKQGYQVRALVRMESNCRNLDGLAVETVFGDLRDRDSLDSALEGCDALFHVAAAYTFWTPDPKVVYETNVKGTENILKSALVKNIKKVVYTSTESTIGMCRNGILACESVEADPGDLAGHYKKSKYLAEKLALKMCRDGLPLVIVNPTVPVGAYDIKPTPTGQFIVDFLNHRMPAYVDTGLNVIDVEDVARGHILALHKGRTGERYILGNRNLTFREMLGILGDITSVKVPRLRLPIWTAWTAAVVDETVSGRIFGKQPRIPLAGVRTARHRRHFDCSKAVSELGLPQTPVEKSLGKAVAWFRRNGYVKGR